MKKLLYLPVIFILVVFFGTNLHSNQNATQTTGFFGRTGRFELALEVPPVNPIAYTGICPGLKYWCNDRIALEVVYFMGELHGRATGIDFLLENNYGLFDSDQQVFTYFRLFSMDRKMQVGGFYSDSYADSGGCYEAGVGIEYHSSSNKHSAFTIKFSYTSMSFEYDSDINSFGVGAEYSYILGGYYDRTDRASSAISYPLNIGIFPPLAIYDNPSIKGIDLGCFATKSENVTGIQISFLHNQTVNLNGIQSGFFNIAGNVKGFQNGLYILTCFLNKAVDLQGGQLGGINIAKNVRGFQFGFVNITNHLNGVQIGLCNIAKSGAILPVMPLFNAGF
jgi:hypothetical protein